MLRRLLPLVVVPALAAGCASVADPDAEVRVSVAAEPLVVASGDSVSFVVEAYNPTDRRIAIAGACGPALEVEVTTPEGIRRYLVAEGSFGGGYPCVLDERHFVDPGETETLRLVWTAPRLAGPYRAVAGLRAGERRLDNRSAPLVVTVR
jgi:hypothetical protein